MVPVQYWILTSMGVNAKTAVLTAFGRNLMVVIPTALSGALGHSKKAAVLWKGAVAAFVGCGLHRNLQGGF